MNRTLWIVQGLLAALFIFAGGRKLARTHEHLTEQLGWPGDYPIGLIRFVGVVELLGAVGLLLPGLTGVAPVLTPVAAAGLALSQTAAVAVHVRRTETRVIFGNAVLIAMALSIAWARFGDYPL